MEKYRPVLFGIPLIVPCSERTTLQDLYKSVWKQVSRLVSPLPPRDSATNHATDWYEDHNLLCKLAPFIKAIYFPFQ